MKLIQVLIEVLLLVSSFFEITWIIQMNATVRMPAKILFALVGVAILVVLIIVLEFIEIVRNHRKQKEQKNKYEEKIESLEIEIRKRDDVIKNMSEYKSSEVDFESEEKA